MSSHVLLIEDDDELRGAIVEYLLCRRHRVTVCGSIAEASEVLANLPAAIAPDAIMSDVFLADGDGVGFFRKMSSRFPEMRWILTATSCDADERMIDALPPSWMTMQRMTMQRETGVRTSRRKFGG